MFLPLLCVFLDTFDIASATKLLIHPRETVRIDDRPNIDTGWSPKPTIPPQPPEFYPWLGAPAQSNLEVRKEVDVNKCGWLSGDPNMPLECGKDVCAYYNSYEQKGFVCCPTAASGAKEAGYCPYRSTCLHNGERGNSHSGIGTIQNDDGVLSCGIDEPFCYAIANSMSAAGDTWYFFGCDTTNAVWSAAMTTTIGSVSGRPTSPPQPASPPSDRDEERDTPNPDAAPYIAQLKSPNGQPSPSETGPGFVYPVP